MPKITEDMITSRLAAQEDNSGDHHSDGVPTVVNAPVLPPNPHRPEGPRTGTGTQPETAAQTRAPAAASATRMTAKTESITTGTDEPPAETEKKSSGISATQLTAGAAAAATSSIIGGQLGVAGTVVGAGVASIISALAVAFYSKSLHAGHEHVARFAKQHVRPKKAAADAASADKGAPTVTGAAAPVTGTGAVTAEGARVEAQTDVSAADGAAADSEETSEDSAPLTWQQKLRRKRVVYPVVIGVATFGIGLGAVVMAESFTGVDISPGTSQLTRTVTGNSSTGQDTGDSGGSKSGRSEENSGSESGTSENDGTGSQGTADSSTEGTTVNNPGSTDGSGNDATGTTDGADETGANGTDSTTGSDATGSGSSSSGSDDSGSSTAGGGGSSGSDSGSATSGGSGESGAAGSSGGSDGAGSTADGASAAN